MDVAVTELHCLLTTQDTTWADSVDIDQLIANAESAWTSRFPRVLGCKSGRTK